MCTINVRDANRTAAIKPLSSVTPCEGTIKLVTVFHLKRSLMLRVCQDLTLKGNCSLYQEALTMSPELTVLYLNSSVSSVPATPSKPRVLPHVYSVI